MPAKGELKDEAEEHGETLGKERPSHTKSKLKDHNSSRRDLVRGVHCRTFLGSDEGQLQSFAAEIPPG